MKILTIKNERTQEEMIDINCIKEKGKETFDKVYKVVKEFLEIMSDPYYQGVAEQLAFFFLLSIVPIFILLSQIFGLFSISMNYLSSVIEKYVAPEVADVIIGMFQNENTGAMNVVFIAISLWAASKSQFALIRIANYTIHSGKDIKYNYVKERLRAVQSIILTMFSITFGLLILVYGELIIDFVAMFIKEATGMKFEVHVFWLILRWPITMILYFLMVSYNYYIIISKDITFKEILPGSLFGATGILVVTIGYKYYMERMANFDILYGSMATIVALMMWFYFLSWVLVLGIIVNKTFINLREQK